MSNHVRLLHSENGLEDQRGQVLLALLVILVIGLSALIYALVSPNRSTVERDKITATALAQAKDALIGYAAAHATRPGALPCPDLNNDGNADAFIAAECPGFVASSNVYLGRLPWQTLGLPDLRDSDGERLWYAVSRDFARNPSCLPNCPLTSDTLGQLTVTGTPSASNVIVIVFSPGTSFSTQTRNLAGENTASNYLEAENANGNNATFVIQAKSTTFNDQLLPIQGRDLMPAVEQRVAREIISLLNAYRAATATSILYALVGGIYPWADLADGNSNAAIGNAYNHNRFPCGNALPVDWGTMPLLGTTPTPTLPNWLRNGCWATGWTSLTYYAVARNHLDLLSLPCSTCTLAASLSITNPSNSTGTVCTTTSPTVCTTQIVPAGNADLVLITPGAATIANRNTGWSNTSWNPISLYFEDFENTDNDDTFTVPTSTNLDRDRIYVVR